MPGQPYSGTLEALLQQQLQEQRRQWRSGQPLSIEAHVEQHPLLRSDTEAILQLVYNEVLLREERGEKPRLEEYCCRFPELTEDLALQFEAHVQLRALSPNEASGPGGGERTGYPTPPTQPPDSQAAISTEDHAGREAKTLVPVQGIRPPLLPGYEVLEKLGEGGMGVVYKARQLHPGRIVAVKMILEGLHVGPEHRMRFLSEAEVVGRLGMRTLSGCTSAVSTRVCRTSRWSSLSRPGPALSEARRLPQSGNVARGSLGGSPRGDGGTGSAPCPHRGRPRCSLRSSRQPGASGGTAASRLQGVRGGRPLSAARRVPGPPCDPAAEARATK